MVMACIIYLDFCFKPTKVYNAEASSYDQWLPDWLNHLICGSPLVQFQWRPATYRPHSIMLPGNIIYEITQSRFSQVFTGKPSFKWFSAGI